MCARALLWAYGDQLITLQHAADVARVSVQAVSQAVDAGRLGSFIDPDAPARQGRTLVSRTEVLQIDWQRQTTIDATNRYRSQDKRDAYEDCLAMLRDQHTLDGETYRRLLERCEGHGLSTRHAQDVASKALQVERHRRTQQAQEETEQ